jgi:hypothetical protein
MTETLVNACCRCEYCERNYRRVVREAIVAIARESDLFGYVQRNVFEASNVRRIPSARTLHVTPEEPCWHDDHTRADHLFGAYEAALASGRRRKADRLLARWLHQVHADRVAYLRCVARERGLRLEPIGRGPLADRPVVYYRDRLPWYLTPVARYNDRRLPDRASDVVETWNGAGTTFDALFIADEPVSSGHFPVHDLIGAVSADGRTADWYVLDRWAS